MGRERMGREGKGWERKGRDGKGRDGMETEWRWVVGKVGFGGGQGETLAEGGGWVGRERCY